MHFYFVIDKHCIVGYFRNPLKLTVDQVCYNVNLPIVIKMFLTEPQCVEGEMLTASCEAWICGEERRGKVGPLNTSPSGYND